LLLFTNNYNVFLKVFLAEAVKVENIVETGFIFLQYCETAKTKKKEWETDPPFPS
jgi:hypothetical protein